MNARLVCIAVEDDFVRFYFNYPTGSPKKEEDKTLFRDVLIEILQTIGDVRSTAEHKPFSSKNKLDEVRL